jgi:hypothetical protein
MPTALLGGDEGGPRAAEQVEDVLSPSKTLLGIPPESRARYWGNAATTSSFQKAVYTNRRVNKRQRRARCSSLIRGPNETLFGRKKSRRLLTRLSECFGAKKVGRLVNTPRESGMNGNSLVNAVGGCTSSGQAAVAPSRLPCRLGPGKREAWSGSHWAGREIARRVPQPREAAVEERSRFGPPGTRRGSDPQSIPEREEPVQK